MIKENLWYDEFINSIVRNITEEKTAVYKIITFFASTYFLMFLSLVLIIVLKDRLMKVIIPINLLASALINNILLKLIFKR